MEQALKLIISKSGIAMREAIKCLQAIRVSSPMTQVHYNHVVDLALNDPGAEFTPDERALLAESLHVIEDDTRGFTLRIRLSDAERAHLQYQAEQAGVTMSEYARQRIF